MARFNRAFRTVALSGILGVAAQVPAWAQSSQAQQPSAAALEAARTACASDLQQFCAGVKPGGGRILACLKEHRDQVSPGCKQAVMSALQGSGAGAGGAPASGGSASPAPSAPAGPSSQSAPNAGTAATAATTSPTGSAQASTKPVAHADGGAPHLFKLKRMAGALKDGDKETMRVFTLLAPEDWTLVGGFTNKTDAGSCFADAIEVRGAVKSADGAYGMGVAPRSSFRWADDPAVRQQMERRDEFDAKYKLKDCPIKAPMHAADFMRENLVWKFHKDKPQVTAEPFPELEQLVRAQWGLGPQSGGAGSSSTRVDVARIRTSATGPDGVPIDEWWSAAIVVQSFPVAGRGLGYSWHAERVTVFQTPKGEIDGYDKLYRVMATSVRLDPDFQKWQSDLVGKETAARAAEIRKQNAAVAEFQQHVIETLQGVTANAQRGSLQAAYGADQLTRGVQTFRDPSTGRTVELSNLYDHAWSNGNDQYIVTDDPNYNPNGRASGDWGELQLVRPQP
jgi:hypothetical protein